MKKLIIFALLLTVNIAISQDYRFGKVSKEELLETVNSEDTEATATILYRSQKVYFDYNANEGFVQRNEIHERIKIYNKEGFDRATKKVVLYNKSNSTEEEIRGLKAVTYNIENGKIIEDKLKNNGVFEEENNEYWKTEKFTMPNVKEGCVIEYKYTIQSPFLAIDDIEFQQRIPIKVLEVNVRTPEYFNYKILSNLKSNYQPKIIKSQKNGKIIFNSTMSNQQSNNVHYIQNVITVNEFNVPALKDESYVDNLQNYQSKLIMELESTKYPNSSVKSFSTTWEKVTKTIYDSQSFGTQIDKKGYYEDDIDALINSVTSAEQKIALIFEHVKSKVKWNEMRGYYTQEGVRKAYKDGSGNVADINLMLVSMLRHAEFNADPVLVSTKDNGIPILPTREGFNYVICIVNIDGKQVLLDASQKFSTINVLPIKTLNWQGRLIKENGESTWVELMPKTASKEIVSLNVNLNDDLSAEGKVRNHYTDYQAQRKRNNNDNSTDDEITGDLEEDKVGLEISNLEVENSEELSEPFKYSYDYEYNSALEEIANKLYFSPLLFLAPKDNPFKEDARQYPIDFVYPIEDKYMINIMLPEGYAVESLPENIIIQFNGAEGEFSFLARANGNLLQIVMVLKLNKTLIMPQEYEEFKKFYQIMIEKQTEKVVLIKA